MPLIRNAQILTLEPGRPTAADMRYDSLIRQVGSLTPLPREEVLDLDGAFVLPGLWDSHIHLLFYAMSLRQLDLGACTSLAQFLTCLGDYARNWGGEWVEGFGWAESQWPPPEARIPTLQELDAASPRLPIFLARSDLHSALVNSAAFRLAGVTASTPDPHGGVFEKDSQGQLTGRVLDEAMHRIREVIPGPSQAQLDEALKRAVALLHRWGVVGVCDQRLQEHSEGAQALEMYRRLAPRLRIHCNLAPHQIDQEGRQPFGMGDNWLRIGHVKFYSDGSLGSRTARLKQAYPNHEGRGLWLSDPQQLREGFLRARKAGYPISVHAIGDEAIAAVLAIFEEMEPYPLDRIEHLQILHPDDVARVAKWGGVASMQPVHLLDDRTLADRLLGERASGYYRLRTLHDRGVRLSFGSDAPVATADPWLGIKAACQRRRRSDEEPWYPDECLTAAAALHAYSLGAAASLGWTQTGCLKPGYWADWIAVDRNPLTCPDPAEVKVLRTVVGGEIVY